MRRSIGLVPCALLFLSLAGCKVTREDIDTWMGTQKGPGKIVAVLLADKYEDDLRTYAGLALVRMEPRENLDGVAELQAAVAQLEPEDERRRIVDLMVPGMQRLMRGEDAPQAGGAEADSVPPRQIRAKDAAFLLIPYASPAKRQELIDSVVDWFVVDFNQRNLAGNYTADQVVRQLGAPAASRLVNAMNARLPQQALVKLAELIATLGDDETKQRAAERLVAIETEMEGREFLDWLKQRLMEQVREREPNAQVDDARLTNAAEINRENFITLGVLPAMKHLNSQRAVQDRLLAIAQSQGDTGAIVVRRGTALLALEGGTRADQVDAILEIALVPNPPPRENRDFDRLRDAAFDRLSDTRSTTVLSRLWQVFTETENWVMRWRVGTLILTLGGHEVVPQFFERLDDESYAREELHDYGERLSQMRTPQVELINTQLQSEQWFDRVIALYFWEKHATANDISHISGLEGDSAATSGEHWPEDQNTVGEVAHHVANQVRQRLREAAQRARGSEGSGARTE
jgi:hypothetical protein